MKDITEVALSHNVSTRTLRYYEELGMLKPLRTKGNKRIYSKAECVKLRLIIRGKKFGFLLDEIKEMILLFDMDRTGKKQLERTIEFGSNKIIELEEKINELTEMKTEMEKILITFEEKLIKIRKEREDANGITTKD